MPPQFPSWLQPQVPSAEQVQLLQPSADLAVSPGVQPLLPQPISVQPQLPESSQLHVLQPSSASFVSPSVQPAAQASLSQLHVVPSQVQTEQPSFAVAVAMGLSHLPPSTGSMDPTSDSE